MKRLTSLLLILSLLLIMCGCTTDDVQGNASHTFSSALPAESISSGTTSDTESRDIAHVSPDVPSDISEDVSAGQSEDETSLPQDESQPSDESSVPEEISRPDESVPPQESSVPDESSEPEESSQSEESSQPDESSQAEENIPVDKDGYYYDAESVVLYLYYYGKLPSNYYTKSAAKNLGSSSAVYRYVEYASIGGDRFYNNEGLLPRASGFTYTECDIDTYKKSRGTKRLVFSSNGHYYYTTDHYSSFVELIVEDGRVVKGDTFR